MNSSVISRLSWLKKPALIIFGVLVTLLLFLWLVLPRIIQWQAEKFITEKTGHRLTLDRPEFNPFEWRLQLHKLQLSEADGKPLLAFENLLVDISAASLTQRAFVFDAIRLDGLEVTLVELAGGALNWTPLLNALKSKDDPPEEKPGLPRLDIRSFILAGGVIDFADRRSETGFATRVEPLDLILSDISTLADDTGKFKIEAVTSIGAQIALAGEVDLNPLAISGNFSLQGLKLDQLAPYLKDALPAPPAGVAAVTAHYRAGNTGNKLDVVVDQVEASLTGLRVPLDAGEGAGVTIGNVALKGGNFDLSQQILSIASIVVGDTRLELPRIERSLELASIALEDAQINLAERQAKLAKVALAGGNLHAVRSPEGKIYLLEALTALANSRKGKSSGAAAAEAQPWRFMLDQFEVADFDVLSRNEGVTPPAEFKLERIALQVSGISENLNAALPVKLAFNVGSGGRFEGEGKYAPAGPVVDFNLKLTDLVLLPAQPYLAAQTTLKLTDGKLSSQGRVIYNDKGPNVQGEFSVRDLRLTEADTGKPLLAWKNLSTSSLKLTQKQLDLGELRLGGLDTKLIIDKDKNINFKQVMKSSGAEVAAVPTAAPAPADARSAPPPADNLAAVPASAPAATRHAAPPDFIVNIDRLRFYKGEMDFADFSLILPFGTRIHNLRGSIAGLSNRPGAVGQIELDGEVDDYGMARAIGSVNLTNPTDALDMRVQFRNVEMTRLTPYMATFAGRKIDSGKLSLDLQYKIKQRQLQGENQVIMDKLTLGERVESATAQDLPLDLALAILQDSDGRIDLGLPVAGSLDDPEFSYGSIVWKAITNVLTKIVTAPFRALGALFGGGGEAVESIAFEAGAPQLTPPEREKLVRLAEAMAKRPALMLLVGGVYTDADRVALQEVQLRRAVLVQSGQRVPEKGDPGPVSTQQPKIREALETLYKDRVGASDLAALKEGFRSANPGQLEEGVTGKMMSRITGLMREKKTLNESEVAQLKGADFYAVLFEHLRAKEVIADERLQSLAKARGEGVVEILKSAGVTDERVKLLPPEQGKLEGAGASGEIPLRMSLEPAKTSQ